MLKERVLRMDKKLILSKSDTKCLYKPLIDEGIHYHEDSTSQWETAQPR